MTNGLDTCQGCAHERQWHEGGEGCLFYDRDRLGFVREVCDCERFVEVQSQEGKATK